MSTVTTAPVDLVVDALERADCRPRRSGPSFMARCPAHPDASPSLRVSEGAASSCLLFCLAGCRPGEIVSALGLALGDLFPAGDHDDEPWRRAVFPRTLTRRQPTLDELERDYPAWRVWRDSGGTLAEAREMATSPTGLALSWVVFRVRDAYRVGHLATLNRIADAFGAERDSPTGIAAVRWLAIAVEASARDAWHADDRQTLARAVMALDDADEIAA